MRSRQQRIADVRRVLEASRRVHERREELLPALVESTGLSPQGVRLGFESMELEASDAELQSFVDAAGSARHVHVVLSANVFVAPLRAIALARAAADRVTVRASERDPVIARALVEALDDEAIDLGHERDVSRIEADVLHVYGRDETINRVTARARSGSVVFGHGAGMGVALVSPIADARSAARDLALDVAAFDQRGCLSPRVALVLGDVARAASFAEVLHEAMTEIDARVPRGALSDEERAEAIRWSETLAFVGRCWHGSQHGVGLDPGEGLAIPPSGRHVLVLCAPDSAVAAARISAMARGVVVVGSDDPELARRVAPPHARVASLGRMQRPAFDGPVDGRPSRGSVRPATAVT